MSHKRKTEDIKLRKVALFLKSLSSKWRVSTKSHNGFHLLERTLVVAANLVGTKERM
jgi:hypothetical protein